MQKEMADLLLPRPMGKNMRYAAVTAKGDMTMPTTKETYLSWPLMPVISPYFFPFPFSFHYKVSQICNLQRAVPVFLWYICYK